MNVKQIVGAICCLVAAVLGVYGIITVSRGPAIDDPSGLGVSHAVGAFLPAFVVLIVGVWLLGKKTKKG